MGLPALRLDVDQTYGGNALKSHGAKQESLVRDRKQENPLNLQPTTGTRDTLEFCVELWKQACFIGCVLFKRFSLI